MKTDKNLKKTHQNWTFLKSKIQMKLFFFWSLTINKTTKNEQIQNLAYQNYTQSAQHFNERKRSREKNIREIRIVSNALSYVRVKFHISYQNWI